MYPYMWIICFYLFVLCGMWTICMHPYFPSFYSSTCLFFSSSVLQRPSHCLPHCIPFHAKAGLFFAALLKYLPTNSKKTAGGSDYIIFIILKTQAWAGNPLLTCILFKEHCKLVYRYEIAHISTSVLPKLAPHNDITPNTDHCELCKDYSYRAFTKKRIHKKECSQKRAFIQYLNKETFYFSKRGICMK